jgi:hypothetical protein
MGLGIEFAPMATPGEILNLFYLSAKWKRPVFVHLRRPGSRVIESLSGGHVAQDASEGPRQIRRRRRSLRVRPGSRHRQGHVCESGTVFHSSVGTDADVYGKATRTIPSGQNGKYIAQGKRCSPAILSSRISVRKRQQVCRDAFNHRIYDSVERCADAFAPFFPTTIRSPGFASRFSSRRIGLPRFE